MHKELRTRFRGKGLQEMSGKVSRTQLSAWTVLVLGTALSVLAFRYVAYQVEEDTRSQFEEQCRDIHRAISNRLASYSSLLLGLRGLHQASDTVSRREFRNFVTSLELPTRYPAVAVMNYAAHVPANMKSRFEQQVRQDDSVTPGGYPAFTIRPPEKRPEYQPLLYLEPFDENRNVMGLDLLQNRTNSRLGLVKDTMELRSAGELVRNQPGNALSMRLAVHRKGAATGTLEERRRAFAGTVGMGFSLARLITEAVMPSTLTSVRVRIHNVGHTELPGEAVAANDANLLIDSRTLHPAAAGNGTSPIERAGNILEKRMRMEFGGALLELSFESRRQAYSTPLNHMLPLLVLGIGLVISLLLFSLIRSLVRSRDVLEAAVAERTDELEQANRKLQQEISERTKLEREVFQFGVEERRWMGQELHDNIGQRLTAVGFMAEALAKDLKLKLRDGFEQASRIGSQISETISQTRLLARGLNPVAVEAGGLTKALERLTRDVSETCRIDCRFSASGMPVPENALFEHNLYRMAQQSITNAIAHGHATQVRLELTNDARRLRMAIIDNGVGFEHAHTEPNFGLGLRIMRYRCSALGLDLKIEHPTGGGSAIIIEQVHTNEQP